jgi:hypothetical protein
VVDCDALLQVAAGDVDVAAQHQLVAPTLVRSQALSALYEASRRGEISAAEGIEGSLPRGQSAPADGVEGGETATIDALRAA